MTEASSGGPSMPQATRARDTRLRELSRLKAAIDAKWAHNEQTLTKSLEQGMITWRRRKDGDWEVKLKPDI